MKPTNSDEATRAGEADGESESTRAFFRITTGSTAIGLGCALATIQALRAGPGGFRFEFSAGTVAAFAVGALAGLLYWRVAMISRFAARCGQWALVVFGLGLFFYPLRFVPAKQFPLLALGLVTAILVLSMVAFFLWRIGRYLDADEEETESAQDAESTEKKGS